MRPPSAQSNIFNFPLVIALILTLVLSGCSTFTPYRIATQQEIDQWVKNNQYGIALSVLENKARLLPTKAVKNSLETIKTKASEYDKKQAASVLKLQSSGKWEEALSILHSSLQNYPEGKQLQRAQKTLQGRQGKNILNLEAQLLIEKAEWLSQNLKIYQNMQLIDPQNRSIKWNMANTQSEIKFTAGKLHAFGQSALSKKEYDLAEICLHTANRLHPTKEHSASLALLEQKTRKTTDKEINVLLEKMKQAIEKNRLEDGRKFLAQIEAMKEHPPEITSLKKILDKKISTEVNRILEEGNVFYKNSKIEKAKQTWKKALKLDPKNEQINERISRAEKALETLKELKKAKSVK